MATGNNNGWQRWLIGALLGLLLGGGGSTIYGNAQLRAAEMRLNADIKEAKQERDKNFDILIELSYSVARMESQLEYIAKKVE